MVVADNWVVQGGYICPCYTLPVSPRGRTPTATAAGVIKETRVPYKHSPCKYPEHSQAALRDSVRGVIPTSSMDL